jgi:hypothetical protein
MPYRTTMGSLAGRFPTHDISQVEDLLEQVLRAESSWCNLTFESLEDEEQQPESALFGFLAARGPANPLATVMAATNGRRPRPIEVGIQHRAGVKAAGQLREAQLFVPDAARVAQDHPRRGLVVQWPETADVAVLAAWLFPAMRVLGRAPTTDAVLYEWNGSAT